MRTLFVALIALFACFAVSCCGSSPAGSLSVSKAVMDTTTGTNTGDQSTGGDGSETDPDYIWYDSEGDYFDD